MAKTIEEIYKERPSVLRSTVIIWGVKIIAFVLAALFFILGIGLLIMPEFLFEAIENILIDNVLESKAEAQIIRLMYLFGFLFLAAGIIISVLIYFFNMVLSRNRFIKELEAWFSKQYNTTEDTNRII